MERRKGVSKTGTGEGEEGTSDRCVEKVNKVIVKEQGGDTDKCNGGTGTDKARHGSGQVKTTEVETHGEGLMQSTIQSLLPFSAASTTSNS